MHDSFLESPAVNFVSPGRESGSLERADPAAGPFAGKRYSHAEYDIISNKGSASKASRNNAAPRTLHNSDDPVVAQQPARNAVSSRPSFQAISVRKSLRALNLEKQRQKLADQARFPGLAGKIHDSPSRWHETTKLHNSFSNSNRVDSSGRIVDPAMLAGTFVSGASASFVNQPHQFVTPVPVSSKAMQLGAQDYGRDAPASQYGLQQQGIPRGNTLERTGSRSGHRFAQAGQAVIGVMPL